MKSNSLSSKEFLINMPSTPDKDSVEYADFWRNERTKIREGVTINGVFFSPFLYWHLNYWSTFIDTKVNNRPLRKLGRPDFWDSMIKIDDTIRQADELEYKKGVLIVGSRRISKSLFSASYNAHKAVAYRGSEVLISGLNQPDIKVITDYIDLGLRNLPEYFLFSRIEDDWKKQVTLGYKDKESNMRNEWSKFHMRNFDEGNNTEAAAGLTLSAFFLDEAGKGKWINCFTATTPCFDSPFGWRCVPIVTATGGDMKKANDVQQVFHNPEAHNFLTCEAKEDGTQISLFIPGTQSLKVPKIPTPYSEFLGIPKGSELDDIIIHTANEEKGRELILKSRDQIKKAEGMEAYLKEIMYYPLTAEECFLDVSENVFPVELLQEQLHFVEGLRKPDNVELFRDLDNKVKHKFTEKKPVSTYPANPKENLEGVVQIWEYPRLDAPQGLYVAGTDPYKFAQAAYSTSLGVTYVYKRINSLTGEGWRNRIVACYAGRPKKMETWYETTKLLLEYYNAKTLCENMDYGFIQHCIEKNEAHKYHEYTPPFLTEVHPSTTVNRKYGIHMTLEIKQYLVACIMLYLNEVFDFERDEKGNVTKEKLGVTRITDPLLLKELLRFSYKNVNADRVIAFGLTLAMAKDLNKRITISSDEDPRYKSYSSKNKIKSPFRTTSNPFRSTL